MQLKVKVTPEERRQKMAQAEFESKVLSFTERKFTTDDIWERRELREELFVLFDEYYDIKDITLRERNARKTLITEGTDEDHEARYQDYIKTKIGRLEYDHRLLSLIFDVLEARYPPRETMTIGEAKRISLIMEGQMKLKKIKRMMGEAIKKASDWTADFPLDPKQPDFALVLSMDLESEKAFAKRTAKSSDYAAATQQVTKQCIR